VHREGILVDLRVNGDHALLIPLEFADVLGDLHGLGRLSVRAGVLFCGGDIDLVERTDRGAEFLGAAKRNKLLLDGRHVVVPSMRPQPRWFPTTPQNYYQRLPRTKLRFTIGIVSSVSCDLSGLLAGSRERNATRD
jgi:hypothetical protein